MDDQKAHSYNLKEQRSAELYDDIEATRDVLFDTHRALLRAVAPIRLVNRLILFVLVLFQLVYGTPSVFHFVGEIVVAALVSMSWLLHESSVQGRISRIEEHIVQADQSKTAEGWVEAYINWQHTRWEQERVETLLQWEPIIWFVLLLALTLWSGLISIIS